MKKTSTWLISAAVSLCVSASAQTTAVKKVFVEEFTTTLCGNCPPKSHNVNAWHELNKNKSVFMTHHAGFGTDKMTTADASAICKMFSPSTFGFAPAIMIDRDVYPWLDSVPYMTVNGFDTVATRVSKNSASVSVNIQGTYNKTTRALDVTATASFTKAVTSGNYRLCVYLVEDSVIGSGSGYDQACYDAKFANTYYPGHYNASTHLISSYPHRMVERQSLSGGTWGTAGIIPLSPATNTPYSTSATFTVPANYNDARMYIVAYVALQGATKLDKNVLNVNDVKIKSVFNTNTTTSVEPIENSLHINSIYPNPAKDRIGVAFTSMDDGMTSVSITDLSGRTVIAMDESVNLIAGKYELFIDVSSLDKGLYFLTLKTGHTISTQKFIVER